MEFYTVLFGVSRAFGVAAQLIWDRALGARAYISASLEEINGSCHLRSTGTSQVVLHRLYSEDVCQQELIGLFDVWNTLRRVHLYTIGIGSNGVFTR